MWVHGSQGDVGVDMVDMAPHGYPEGTLRVALTLYRKGRSLTVFLSPQEARAVLDGLGPQVRLSEASQGGSRPPGRDS